MSSKWRLVLAFALGCGGARETASSKPVVLPTPSATASASTPADAGAPTACLDPYEGGKTVDQATLANADAANVPKNERLFIRGRVYFTAERWVDAAKAYRELAFDAPDSSQGVYGAQLYLESLNQLGSRGGRTSCFDDMTRDTPLLRDLYCGARRKNSSDTCALLDRLDADLARVRAERLEASGDHRGAAEEFMKLLRARCLPAKADMRCDEIAYNAAIAFLAANDESSAKTIRALMTDPKNKMSTSPLLEKLACRLDGRCH